MICTLFRRSCTWMPVAKDDPLVVLSWSKNCIVYRTNQYFVCSFLYNENWFEFSGSLPITELALIFSTLASDIPYMCHQKFNECLAYTYMRSINLDLQKLPSGCHIDSRHCVDSCGLDFQWVPIFTNVVGASTLSLRISWTLIPCHAMLRHISYNSSGSTYMLLEFVDRVKERHLKIDQHKVIDSQISSLTSSSSMTGLGAREATEGTEGARRGGILASW